MSTTCLNHFSFALGDLADTVEGAADKGRLVSPVAVLKEAGFVKHHVCAPGQSAYDLAKASVEGLGNNLNGVGAIVYSTCIPMNGNVGNTDRYRETRDVKHLMDFPASRLQADFGLEEAIVIGLNQQACTGMLGSIRLAGMILAAEPELASILCVTADRFPDGALYEQSYNLISDGAAACIVSRQTDNGGFRLLASHAMTNGAMSFASDDETVGSFFSYSHSVITKALRKAGLTMNDIQWIVPQNTNSKVWQILLPLLKSDFASVYCPTLSEVAHVISADNIINLRHLVSEGKVARGEKVLLFMAGYGLNWQCLILEKL